MAQIPPSPELYRPDLEVVADDEAKTQQELVEPGPRSGPEIPLGA